MSMREAKAANWVAERGESQGTSFRLIGSSKGYSSFSGAFNPGDEVFYSASDDSGSRESGFATFDGRDLINRQPTATLVNNVYSVSAPQRVYFINEVVVACTFDAAAFNALWKAIQVLDPDGDGDINIPPELIDGLGEALRNKADQSALDAEVKARKEGDANLQDQIDDLGVNAGAIKWSEIEDKPEPIEDLGASESLIKGGRF